MEPTAESSEQTTETIAEVTKVSEINAANLAEYLRLDEPDENDNAMLETLLGSAKEYIKGYTGQEDLDVHRDFVTAVFILVQDMWDNRTLYVAKLNVNKTVEAILGLHSVNLL